MDQQRKVERDAPSDSEQRFVKTYPCPGCQRDVKISWPEEIRYVFHNADIPDPRQVVDEIRHQVNQMLDTVLNNFLLPGD